MEAFFGLEIVDSELAEAEAEVVDEEVYAVDVVVVVVDVTVPSIMIGGSLVFC